MFWSLLTYKIFNTVWVLFISHYPASDTFPAHGRYILDCSLIRKKKYTQNIKTDSKKSIWYKINHYNVYISICNWNYRRKPGVWYVTSINFYQCYRFGNAHSWELNWCESFLQSILWKALRIIITVINKQNIHSLKG